MLNARTTISNAARPSSPAASASASPSAAPSCASRQLFLFDEPLSNLDAALRVHDAAGDRAAAPAAQDDDDLRHPRPGRGDDAGRQDRRAERRQHRAGRLADGALQYADEPVRRRLHRLAEDEPDRRRAGRQIRRQDHRRPSRAYGHLDDGGRMEGNRRRRRASGLRHIPARPRRRRRPADGARRRRTRRVITATPST